MRQLLSSIPPSAHIRKIMDDKTRSIETMTGLPGLERSELVLGDLLGTGSFGIVHEVREFNGDSKSTRDLIQKSEPFTNDKRRKRRCTGFAAKFLLPHLDDPQAAVDMATEAKILQGLHHPNICKLRAVGPDFLLLERLRDTLDVRILKWKRQKRKLFRSSKSKREQERVWAAIHLGRALAYLHKRRIMFRDIKPENCGFDSSNVLKLFDFGLARELSPGDRELTAMTGSARYMAPEVANYEPYDHSCDVYSFGVLIWHVYGLGEEPYEGFDLDRMTDAVWRRPHVRPEVPSGWPASFRRILERSWSPVPAARPGMPEIAGALETMVESSPARASASAECDGSFEDASSPNNSLDSPQ